MKNLKILSALVICLSLFTLLTSCKNEEAEADRKYKTVNLNVYNWGEYISDEDDPEYGLIDINSAFEEYFNKNLADEYKCYIEINYSTYATNEDMYAKLTNSAVSYDIVIPSDYMIQKMIGKGGDDSLLAKIDTSKLDNYKNIGDEFKNMYYDPENTYSVPYSYGMVGIIYNSEFVNEEDVSDQSWELLWNENYKGKILQFNNPRDAFATAMYLADIDINSKNYKDWDKALDMLKEQKPLLQGYVNDEIFNKMQSASAYIAPYFAGDFLTMAAANEDLMFYYPSEGTNYFVDAMCIPKASTKKELAHEYIDFMLSKEAATANALYIGYASPNKAVTDDPEYKTFLSESYDTDSITAWDILYGKSKDDAVGSYSHNPAYEDYYKDDTTDIQTYVNTLWEELKTENSVELWVHITCGIILIAVLTPAVYSVYIKKKRSKNYRARDKRLSNAKKSN